VSEIDAFIHNVHQFAEENYENQRSRSNPSLSLTEAQRAMGPPRKPGPLRTRQVEPEMLLEIMIDRFDSVILALVGGGQEINSGEQG